MRTLHTTRFLPPSRSPRRFTLHLAIAVTFRICVHATTFPASLSIANFWFSILVSPSIPCPTFRPNTATCGPPRPAVLRKPGLYALQVTGDLPAGGREDEYDEDGHDDDDLDDEDLDDDAEEDMDDEDE